jgi:hypothetical protein
LQKRCEALKETAIDLPYNLQEVLTKMQTKSNCGDVHFYPDASSEQQGTDPVKAGKVKDLTWEWANWWSR